MELRKHVGSAAASLAIAAVIWLVVHNLDRSPARLTVSLTYDVPPDVVVTEGAVREVEVRVLATKPKLRTLQASEFDIHVPFRGKVGSQSVVLLPDDVRAPFGVEVELIQPPRFTVVYDEKLSRTVAVRPDIVGQPADGYEVDTEAVRVAPSQVTIVGPASAFREHTALVTTPIDVTGRTMQLGPVRAALVPPTGGITPVEVTDVAVTVPIRPVMVRRTLEVPIEVLRGAYQSSAPNPRVLRVTVEGPDVAMRDLRASDITAALDLRNAAPKADDHRIEPTVTFAEGSCAECRVAGLSQQRVSIRVSRSRSSAP